MKDEACHLIKHSAVAALLLMLCTTYGFAATQDYADVVSNVAAQVSNALDNAHVRGVSVLDFRDLQGTPTELGRLLAQDLSDKLVSLATAYAVVDRQNLNLLLKENNLSQDGLVDPRTRQKLGNLIGIDAVVVGTAVLLGNQARLSVRAVSLETGRIIAANSSSFTMSPELSHLNDLGVRQDENGGAGSSTPRGTGSVKVTNGLSVEVSSVALAPSKAIVATLTFRNIGNRQTLLALYINPRSPFCADFQLNDGRGGYCRACANGEVLSSLPTANPASMLFSEKDWAQLAPMSSAQHVLNFWPRMCSSPITSENGLSINGSVLVDEGKGIRRVPISFSNMQLFTSEHR